MKKISLMMGPLACLILLGCNSENVSCVKGNTKCEKDASFGALSYICNESGQWLPLQYCKECKEDACSDEAAPGMNCDADGQSSCMDLKDKSVQFDCIQDQLIPAFCKDKQKCDDDHCSELSSECSEGEKSCVWIEEKSVAIVTSCKDGQLQSIYCGKGIGCKGDDCDMEKPKDPKDPEEPEEPAFCSGPGEMIEESTQNCICDTSNHWTGEAGSCKCEGDLVDINGICDKTDKCKGKGVTIKDKTCMCNAQLNWAGKAGNCTCEKDHFELVYHNVDYACCDKVDYATDFSQPSCLELENPKKGAICLMGEYRQLRKSEEKQPIQWRVLSVHESGNLLLMSEFLLDMLPYNKTKKDVTWETCTLRSWLNAFAASENADGIDYTETGFLKTAFTEDEREHMVNATNYNLDNPIAGTPGGNNTQDYVFLLSREEGREHLGQARLAYGTSYVTSKAGMLNSFNCRGQDTSEFQYPLPWWTRSSGVTADQARCITVWSLDGDMEVNSGGMTIRPVLWLKKN